MASKPKKRDYSDIDYLVGINHFESILEESLRSADNAIDALEAGAKEFVEDLKKLPKPYREVRKPGYMHLVDLFKYKVNEKRVEVTVGWGKYYGVMLEFGAFNYKKGKQAHMNPLFEKNKKKYEETMKKTLGL